MVRLKKSLRAARFPWGRNRLRGSFVRGVSVGNALRGVPRAAAPGSDRSSRNGTESVPYRLTKQLTPTSSAMHSRGRLCHIPMHSRGGSRATCRFPPFTVWMLKTAQSRRSPCTTLAVSLSSAAHRSFLRRKSRNNRQGLPTRSPKLLSRTGPSALDGKTESRSLFLSWLAPH